MLRVDHAVRQTDVVEDVIHLIRWNGLADVLFDQIAEPRCLFNASAALGAKMQDERTGVAAWKEILSEERNQQKSAGADQ